MTTLTQVYVSVNRAEAIRRGINGTDSPVLVDLDVAAMDQADREDVARRLSLVEVEAQRGWHPHYPAPRLCDLDAGGVGHHRHSILSVADPTQEGVLASLHSERETRETRRKNEADAAAKQAAEDEAQLLEWLARDDESLVGQQTYASYDAEVGCQRNVYIVRSEWSGPHRPRKTDDPRYRERRSRLFALAVAKDEAAREEIRAQRRIAEQDRKDWIAAHGSRRLVTMLAEGIDCERTYQRERERYEGEQFAGVLAEQRPEWRVAEESEIDRDIADVSDRALSLLAAGRQISSTCKLARLKESRQYVCVDTFRGRLIVWPQD